jgi:hypothetical protein
MNIIYTGLIEGKLLIPSVQILDPHFGGNFKWELNEKFDLCASDVVT